MFVIRLLKNKTGGHQTFSGGIPPFYHFSPLLPPEKVFIYLFTHRPAIYRDP